MKVWVENRRLFSYFSQRKFLGQRENSPKKIRPKRDGWVWSNIGDDRSSLSVKVIFCSVFLRATLALAALDFVICFKSSELKWQHTVTSCHRIDWTLFSTCHNWNEVERGAAFFFKNVKSCHRIWQNQSHDRICQLICQLTKIPYRLDTYELSNSTSGSCFRASLGFSKSTPTKQK